MRSLSSVLSVLLAFSPSIALSQNSSSPMPSDGLELLQEVAQHYAQARSYFIESIEERSVRSDLFHQWSKQILSAAEEPDGRFDFDGHRDFGDAARISDGRTVWKYHAQQHRYTENPASELPAKHAAIGNSEMGMFQAENLRRNLAALAQRFKSARRLPDADLVLEGREHRCAVVSMKESDLKRMTGDGSFNQTVWIDKRTQTILKVVEHSTLSMNGIPQESEVTTLYPGTKLDAPLPESLFAFSPPADAHQVKEFPSAREEALGATLMGDRVPPLKLRAADGTVTPIESFRGKTVLIDLWATWCAPCVAALPAMAKLAQEGKDKGLALIAIDYDEDANKAAEYLKQKGLALTNFHDGDGEFRRCSVPHPCRET